MLKSFKVREASHVPSMCQKTTMSLELLAFVAIVVTFFFLRVPLSDLNLA